MPTSCITGKLQGTDWNSFHKNHQNELKLFTFHVIHTKMNLTLTYNIHVNLI